MRRVPPSARSIVPSLVFVVALLRPCRACWWRPESGRTCPFPSAVRQMRHRRGKGHFRRSVPSWSQAVASGGLRTGHGAFAISRNLKSTSPTGRWRSRRSPPPLLKFRVALGLRLRLCLDSRCESPSPVPRNCRCAPGAPRYNAARSIRLVARKRHTQRGRLDNGPPFPFQSFPRLPPLRRSQAGGSKSISRFRCGAIPPPARTA